MGDRYRLVGSVEPGSRIDQVDVGDGVVLTLHDPAIGRVGNVEELDSEQVDRVRRYVILEQVDEDDVPLSEQAVDQPGVNRDSTSTQGRTGNVPDIDSMNGTELRAEVDRIREITPGALPEIKGNSKNEEIQGALKNYYAEGGVS